jgi:hypothetical protein
MRPQLTIVVPDASTEYELDYVILSVKSRLAFLESPLCRDIMPQERRLLEIKSATIHFKSLLAEREVLRMNDTLYS